MRNFRELIVWQRSMELTKKIYGVTTHFPDDEKFGLTSQIRRATVSVSSNIAEGSSRKSEKDFVRFLQFSLGSVYEVETQLLVAEYAKYIKSDNFKVTHNLVIEVQRMLNTLINKINKQ